MALNGTDQDVQHQLIKQLLMQPDCFGHGVDNIIHIETHISHLLLVGQYAYKIKKPVNLGFLDFSTLEKRYQCCLEELRLNQRLAPNLYLEVVAIGGSAEVPEIGEVKEPREYAVKMLRFRQQDLFDRRSLDRKMIDRLALLVAGFHQSAALSSDPSHGRAERFVEPVLENFRVIRELKHPLMEVEVLNSLQTWTEQQAGRLGGVLEERFEAGNIRECHGDLHLGNITLFEGKITPFDGIEFNPSLRWIDTLSDIAFLLMDLQHRGLNQFADQLLNCYLEQTGDYAGLPLLRFYLLYRAMVRAKVCAIRVTQPDLPLQEQSEHLQEYLSYLTLAESVIRHPPASLIITHGVSGSGKSTVSGWFAEQLMAIRIRSDVERQRLFPEPADKVKQIGNDRYSIQATQITYAHLSGMARHLLQAGFSVIIDATCLLWWQRHIFIRLADNLRVPMLILDCQAQGAVLQERVAFRSQRGEDASEAGLEVLAMQQKIAEPFTSQESERVISIDSEDFPPSGLLATVLQRLMR
jgi:aminoglycoside phosphotransferase family enzyme/adenylate kinase family enzyme